MLGPALEVGITGLDEGCSVLVFGGGQVDHYVIIMAWRSKSAMSLVQECGFV